MTVYRWLMVLLLLILLPGCAGQQLADVPETAQAEPTSIQVEQRTDPLSEEQTDDPAPTAGLLAPESTSPPVQTPLPTKSQPSPPGIILLIGDGMGAAHRQAATWLALGEGAQLVMDSLPVHGWAENTPLNDTITDSAAAGTAMATGHVTANRMISLDSAGTPLPTILELAEQQGWATGLVTTVQLAHATPAVFAAHVPDRQEMPEIARQMIANQVDVLLGGGEDDFFSIDENGCYPGSGSQPRNQGLVGPAIEDGYTYICTRDELLAFDPSSNDQLLGLFAADEIPAPFSPSLAEMTQAALSVLSRDPDGFFLMVEAGQIDWAGHANQAEEVIQFTIGLDLAVTHAVIFSLERENTLLIVTADHETGGLSVNKDGTGSYRQDGPFHMPDGTPFWIDWTTTGHTARPIPVSAQGPYAELLAGNYHLTHIFEIMAAMMAENDR